MRIIVAQAKPVLGDFIANLAYALKYYHWANDLGAQLLVLPELFSTGYIPEDLLLRESYIQSLMHQIHSFAKEIRSLAVLIGSPWKIDEALHNSCLFIANGQVQHITHKSFLPNDSVFDEYRYFTPGASCRENNIITIHNQPYIIAICQDLWRDEFSHSLSNTQAAYTIAINASPYHINKQKLRYEVAERFCRTTSTNLIYCNQVMMHDSILYEGASFIMHQSSNNSFNILQCHSYQEQLMQLDLDDDEDSSGLTVTNFDVKDDLLKESAHKKIVEMDNLDELYGALIFGIREYFAFHNFNCVYIALSGGIDSALTTLLACDALGSQMVHTIYMPTKFNSSQSATDSSAIAIALQTDHTVIEIDMLFEHYQRLILPHIHNKHQNSQLEASLGDADIKASDVALQNIQARIRGDIIMSFANANSALVLGTSNKSELACGYATLYGDMACGFNPLKDLYKTQVYNLVKFRNKHLPKSVKVYNHELDVINASVLNKKPSAELRDEQYDEQDLPEYSILDKILKTYLEDSMAMPPDNDELFKRVVNMIGSSEFKRKQAPLGIKVGHASFDKERRYPIMLRRNALLY
ncbi:Glutamine-dependent NAD(+) synthetase [Rickettsiales endosymbiont of Paramecium tredecaurelia]|uniref:NAD+ synthase n=1 Tax=Candidatus Sarmatiella mevalonica TaxID=2770581 RepID=UPI001921B210|nr:NAD+ synthase [Candidatus Sarmatiella mevalonica]MBL3284856.1 Glutamine-dependent NAD(+) synthetase [Candidatus Sarmatiella mevalonica]